MRIQGILPNFVGGGVFVEPWTAQGSGPCHDAVSPLVPPNN
ncbi:MAG TPA: hypothetical protein P5051_01530 [Methanothrix sp.]|nr:hypothetical protein [Methanothrix sp.]